MPDVDSAFDRLRREVTAQVAGPEPGQIVRRARRRTRNRLAAVAAAAAIAVAVPAGAISGGDGGRRTVAPPSATASATGHPRPLRLADLIYGTTAQRHPDKGDYRNLRDRWTITPGDDAGDVQVPGCRGRLETGAPGEEGVVAVLDVSYDGNPQPGDEATSSSRGEQLLAFSDPATAVRKMAGIVRYEQSCHGQGASFARPAIGDEATRATVVRHQADPPITSTENAVVVRQGSVIAVYWDLRNNGPKLASIGDHERDARKMADRLRNLGYHS